MPKAIRRFHTKSRGGCEQCKRMHIKCEENRPVCSGCAKRNVLCRYDEDSSTLLPGSSAGLLDIPETIAPRLDTVNLELMHHFSVHTWKTLDPSSVPPGWWQDMLPKLALEHDHLLYALLALSSLHIACCRSESSQKYVQLGVKYREYTLKLLTTTFPKLDDGNATACFWSSALIGLISFALHRCPGHVRADSRTLLLEVANLWKGSSEIQEMAAMAPKFEPPGPKRPRRMALRPLQDSELRFMLDELRSNIQDDWTITDLKSVKYMDAIDDLVRACHSYEQDGASGSIISWFSCLDSTVIEDFEAKVEAASLLVIFYGVALHKLREAWFIQALPANIVEDLSSAVSLSNRERTLLVNRARHRICSTS